MFFQGAANVPYMLVRSLTGQLQPGAATFFGDSFDLPLTPFPIIEHDGFASASQFHTNANGHANLPGIAPSAAAGTMLSYQAALADPLSAFGVSLTAATGITIAQNWTQTSYSMGDDTNVTINLGSFQVPYYGTNYSTIYACSNGFLTLGAPDWNADYTPTSSEFNAGPPRIAGFWCDLTPPASAVVATVANASSPTAPGFVRIDYNNVLDYGFSVPHTFAIQIYANGVVQIIHTGNQFASQYDQITGIGPGTAGGTQPQCNFVGPPAIPSLGGPILPNGTLGNVNQAFFEWFGTAVMPYYGNTYPNPYDLAGKTLTFFPMGTGGVPQSTQRYLVY
jgi:hypothetical protein